MIRVKLSCKKKKKKKRVTDQSIFASYKKIWDQMNSNSLCHVYIKCWYTDKHLFKKCAKRPTRHTVNGSNFPWRALAVS